MLRNTTDLFDYDSYIGKLIWYINATLKKIIQILMIN